MKYKFSCNVVITSPLGDTAVEPFELIMEEDDWSDAVLKGATEAIAKYETDPYVHVKLEKVMIEDL